MVRADVITALADMVADQTSFTCLFNAPTRAWFGSHYVNRTVSCHGGIQCRFKFDNGYGASVIRHDHSYGGDYGLWELAVTLADGSLCYSTPITDDVIGYLTAGEVGLHLNQIEALPLVSE